MGVARIIRVQLATNAAELEVLGIIHRHWTRTFTIASIGSTGFADIVLFDFEGLDA